LRLDHPAILEQHAQIFFSQDQYWVKDLTGQRSVQVNRQPIAFQAPLKLNDTLALSPQGPAFRFLGEGRLIELTEPPMDEPGSDQERGGAEQKRVDKQSDKRPSFIKKILH
jgi:pSer/pThr/pTyr-binding forkhead associated (FHA) protein